MQINASTNSIIAEIDSLCDSTATSYPLEAKIRRVNIGQEDVAGFLLDVDGRWQWDDTRRTDFPVATQAMIAGQRDYAFNADFLRILRVEVLDSNGKYQLVKPIDQADISGVSLTDFMETAGMPQYYDKVGNSIFLYPAPSTAMTTLTAGLKVHYQRASLLFTTVDTTAEPGFASPYHVILAYMAAIPYCMTYKKDRVGMYQQEVERLKQELAKHYSKREEDERAIITMKRINHR